MKPLTRTLSAGLLAGCFALAPAFADETPAKAPRPVIEIAVLLDTSGSMDGLINQARARLWSIINQMASTRRDGQIPELRVALYEYGKDDVPAAEGHIRQIVGLTDDLDKISAELFALKTNGGSEFCGMAIQKAAEQLNWTPGDHYQAIFIAGNEPFTQGELDYVKACQFALKKNIVVNTVHCGPEQEGENGKWKHAASIADGQSINIDQNAQTVAIVAPQDQAIEELGRKMNDTYVAYGQAGRQRKEMQTAQDENAAAAAPGAACERAITKGGGAYKNESWDLVDACESEEVRLEKLKDEELPEELQKLAPEERKAFLEKKLAERKAIQEQIQKLARERDAFVTAAQKQQAESGAQTFDSAVGDILNKQLEKKGYEIVK